MGTERETSGRVGHLGDLAGLPIGIGDDGRLAFLDGLPEVSPQSRALSEMRTVLYNQTATGPEQLYLMYRNLGWPEDLQRFGRHLRFDVTVLVAGLVGGEYVKTAGHYHPPLPHAAPAHATYPELYQVLSGRAHYLLQKPSLDGSPGSLADVVVVEAEPGDAVYVPPGYGHVTINPGPEPLVMANVVDGSFTSEYGLYRERHGGAYYEIEEQDRAYFVANGHYPDPPGPRLARPTKLASLGLRDGQPIYSQLAANPRDFSFLSNPPADGPLP